MGGWIQGVRGSFVRLFGERTRSPICSFRPAGNTALASEGPATVDAPGVGAGETATGGRRRGGGRIVRAQPVPAGPRRELPVAGTTNWIGQPCFEAEVVARAWGWRWRSRLFAADRRWGRFGGAEGGESCCGRPVTTMASKAATRIAAASQSKRFCRLPCLGRWLR
jgi:hypothetical protein